MSQASLTLFSVTFTLFFFSLQLCVSLNLQHFPATSSSSSPPALRSPCWISCGLHCTPAPPSSPFFLSSWRPYPEYSMMAVHLFPPVSCLCMSLSVPIVPLLTCACTVSPHSSFLLPFFYVAHTGLRLSPRFCQACFSRSPLLFLYLSLYISYTRLHISLFNRFIPKSSYTSTEKCVRADTDWSTCICETFTFSGLELDEFMHVYVRLCIIMWESFRRMIFKVMQFGL